MKRIGFLLTTFFVCMLHVLAEEITIEGIGFEIFPETKEAWVRDYNSDYTGRPSLDIPESFEYTDVVYQVTGILGLGNWGGLRSIKIPRTITYISRSAFNEFCTLKEVHITDLAAWCKIKFETTPLWYSHRLFLNGEEIIDLVIPDGVTEISINAFRRLENLKSVTLPDGLETIGDLAFQGCKNLTSIFLPKSLKDVGGYAFSGCTNLTDIVIEGNLYDITEGQFSGLPNLKDVYCYSDIPPSTSTTTFDSTPIEHATLHVPQSFVDNYKTAPPCWNRFGAVVSIEERPEDIEYSTNTKHHENTIYDLQGRRLNKAPERGMYVQDGKKTIIR